MKIVTSTEEDMRMTIDNSDLYLVSDHLTHEKKVSGLQQVF